MASARSEARRPLSTVRQDNYPSGRGELAFAQAISLFPTTSKGAFNELCNIGLGQIGTAIAQAFARQGIEVAVAGRRPVDALAAQIGPSLIPQRVEDAVKADVVVLAMPFAAHRQIAQAAESWQGKVVIDATNAFGVPPEELDGLPSTAAIARVLSGAKVVKAFNHLPAGILAQGPTTPQGGRRVVFISSDDEAASASVAALVERLGFAPIELGKIGEGGLLVQARGNTWGQLIFQDLAKFG